MKTVFSPLALVLAAALSAQTIRAEQVTTLDHDDGGHEFEANIENLDPLDITSPSLTSKAGQAPSENSPEGTSMRATIQPRATAIPCELHWCLPTTAPITTPPSCLPRRRNLPQMAVPKHGDRPRPPSPAAPWCRWAWPARRAYHLGSSRAARRVPMPPTHATTGWTPATRAST